MRARTKTANTANKQIQRNLQACIFCQCMLDHLREIITESLNFVVDFVFGSSFMRLIHYTHFN